MKFPLKVMLEMWASPADIYKKRVPLNIVGPAHFFDSFEKLDDDSLFKPTTVTTII